MKGVAGLLRITWDEAWGIKKRPVARGLSRRTQDVVAYLSRSPNFPSYGHQKFPT